jgi:hypothetical protein
MSLFLEAMNLSAKPSPAGVRRMQVYIENAPSPSYLEEVRQKLLPWRLFGIQFFQPQSLGRVVLVYDDGRLAYDPGPLDENEG